MDYKHPDTLKRGLQTPATPRVPSYRAVCERRAGLALQDWRKAGEQSRLEPRVRIALRPYQREVFEDRSSGILILHWSRQIGKSFTLAAWAVDRLLTRPGRLVTVLSNSRENGAEFVAKCAEVCRLNGTEYTSVDKSRGLRFQNMRMEVRIRAQGKTGRIKVLAANPRTARGFSGDLILDEFAFHEDSNAIWEAAEPILASNPDFLCRMASTGNGRHNLFYRMTEGESGPRSEVRSPKSGGIERKDAEAQRGKIEDEDEQENEDETGAGSPSPRPLPIGWGEGEEAARIFRSRAGFAVSRITRTEAHGMGVKIYDANTREVVTPGEARAQALDKRAYDQNYECVFADENATLLSYELINAAEREDVGVICENDWGNALVVPSRMRDGPAGGFKDRLKPGLQTSDRPACGTGLRTLDLLRNAVGPLYVGFDVARKGDLSVITVMEELNGMKMVRGILRMQDLRLPEQQQRLGEICRLPKFRRAAIDMTGLGLGLFEYAQEGSGRRGYTESILPPACRRHGRCGSRGGSGRWCG